MTKTREQAMDGHLRISSAERKRLLRALHQSSRPEERLRWNILQLDELFNCQIAGHNYDNTARQNRDLFRSSQKKQEGNMIMRNYCEYIK